MSRCEIQIFKSQSCQPKGGIELCSRLSLYPVTLMMRSMREVHLDQKGRYFIQLSSNSLLFCVLFNPLGACSAIRVIEAQIQISKVVGRFPKWLKSKCTRLLQILKLGRCAPSVKYKS